MEHLLEAIRGLRRVIDLQAEDLNRHRLTISVMWLAIVMLVSLGTAGAVLLYRLGCSA